MLVDVMCRDEVAHVREYAWEGRGVTGLKLNVLGRRDHETVVRSVL